MRILLSIVLAAAAAGCSDTSRTQHSTSGGALDEARVLAIARAAVATNDTWVEKAEFQSPQRERDGSWSVTVWRLPKTPGGFRDISIDTNGAVTRYYRGY
jgi:hypothetical protein